MLRLEDVSAAYRGLRALQGVSLRGGARRDRRGGRGERRGQEHAAEVDRRPGGDRGHDRVRGPVAAARAGASDHAARRVDGAGGAAAVSAAFGRGQSAAGRLCEARRGSVQAAGAGVLAVSAPAGAAGAARRDAVGRRAADAGDRPRADDAAAFPDAGRTEPGHHAAAGGRHPRRGDAHPRARRDRPAGGAAPGRGAGDRRPRVCAAAWLGAPAQAVASLFGRELHRDRGLQRAER